MIEEYLDNKGEAPYPWLSIAVALVVVAYFYVFWVSAIDLTFLEAFSLTITPVPELIMLTLALVFCFDIRKVFKARKAKRHYDQNLQAQVQELLNVKKELQSKTHVYASHADKLKLFISDKLLEHIEYDEKYLHFKNIASEVRHNGIICYDKLSTFLDKQWGITKSRSLAETKEIDEARDSLRYLWDLLDLSTADNIALHIANQVCDAEQMLFEAEMNESTQSGEVPDSSHFQKPIFESRSALLKALNRSFGQPPEQRDTFGTWHIADFPSLWIKVNDADQLLGNENHTVLALENIINNAQFYAGRGKKGVVRKNARIAIELTQSEHDVCYRVYNQGPHIDPELAEKLYGLGFSTRRARANHGRGLGLYFVNEISKGYDGKLSFKNVHNIENVLSLRMELMNGEVITEVIEIFVENETPYCRKSGDEKGASQLVWSLSSGVESIEVTHQRDQKTHSFVTGNATELNIEDPCHPTYPCWNLTIGKSLSDAYGAHIEFSVLNISGVQFELRLPTVDARLNGELLATDQEGMDQEVEEIAARFSNVAE